MIVVALKAEAAPITGAPGAVAGGATGVTEFDRAEKAPAPTPLVACTWNWYAVPLVRPVTTRLVAVGPAGRNAPTVTVGAAAVTTRTE